MKFLRPKDNISHSPHSEFRSRAQETGHDPLDLAFCCIFLCAPIAYGFFDIFGNNYASLIDTTATTSTSMSTMFIDSDEEYYRTTRRAPTLHCNYPSLCCPFSRGSSDKERLSAGIGGEKTGGVKQRRGRKSHGLS